MTRNRGVLDLLGFLSKAEAGEAVERIREGREQSSRRLMHTVEKLS
jgi:hypothetical protein